MSKILSLCSGIGGMELGLQLAGIEASNTIFIERDVYCCSILSRRFAPVKPIDIYEHGFSSYTDIDLLVAGFPCQPFSSAARGRNVFPDLWPRIAEIVNQIRPSFIFLENVQRKAIINARESLDRSGYGGAFGALSASFLGAPHRRRRWWALAYTNSDRKPSLPLHDEASFTQAIEQHRERWATDPETLGVYDGISPRLDRRRVKALGNAVCPIQAAVAFRTLYAEIMKNV